jgi:hypothetical protein
MSEVLNRIGQVDIVLDDAVFVVVVFVLNEECAKRQRIALGHLMGLI